MKSLLFSLCILSTALYAQQPGTPDPSFGNKGSLTDPSVKNLNGEVVKVTKTGRILIGTTGPYKGLPYTFRLDALLPDGSPDLSFGEGGSAYVIFPGKANPATYSAAISALALLPDGRILAAGGLAEEGNPGDLAFAQFKPDGTLDSTFGTNGTSSATFGNTDEGIRQIALQPDGKILTAGVESKNTNGGNYAYQFATARYLPNGSVDRNFGSEGIVISSPPLYGAANSIAVQEDGRITVSGFSGANSNAAANFHAERYFPDGSYDKSFGNGGIVDMKIENADVSLMFDMALQPDGKMVATGETHNIADDVYRWTVLRLNADGSLDKAFGNGGSVDNTFSQYSEGKQIMITGEKQDKIVVAGSASPDGSGYDFAVASYTTDGTLDNTFGNEGIQTTDIGTTNAVTSASLQPDGKIVLLGFSDASRALARYYGYPVKTPLAIRIKKWIQNHGISWKGLPADYRIAYYSVEQSNHALSGFTSIARISGTNDLKEYSITNSHLLPGTNYYRIKAVSQTGVIRYSEVASADNSVASASVFPNPARDYVTVQGLPSGQAADIAIKDGSGNVLARGVSGGSAQYRSALGSNMQPGTYYLNVTTGNKTEVLKFVKE